jgi:hypothetical protein
MYDCAERRPVVRDQWSGRRPSARQVPSVATFWQDFSPILAGNLYVPGSRFMPSRLTRSRVGLKAAARKRDDRIQLFFALSCLGCAIAFYLFVQTAPSERDRHAAVIRNEQSDDDLRTGSIIFVPILGNDCHRKEIDNETWTIRDVGPVACNEALAHSSETDHKVWSASRMDAIRDGFRKR